MRAVFPSCVPPAVAVPRPQAYPDFECARQVAFPSNLDSEFPNLCEIIFPGQVHVLDD